MMLTWVILISLAACTSQPAATQAPASPVDFFKTETDAEREDRMDWWKEARFGMFIHWGLYAIPAGEHQGQRTENIGEWIMEHLHIPIAEYEAYAAQFNPQQFNAEEWVAIAKQAGMKYIVITSKHHDGFALWDSEVSPWNIIDATPYDKDILAELARACAAQGIKLCFYHSIMDWHHPDAQAIFEPTYHRVGDQAEANPQFPRYVETFMKPQLRELLTNYGDIGVMWFDGEWIPDFTTEMGKDLYNFIRNIQPEIIINNRVDKGRNGMAGLNAAGDFAGDFGTPEQEIPAKGIPGVDWESCMTMNDTWGYKHFDHNWKSSETLIRHLVDIVSKGGNFLLNVGPTAEGVIPEESVARLQDMGRWMEINGEAIYGAEASPYERPSWGRYTKKGEVLYAHVFDWPSNRQLVLPALPDAKTAILLSDGSSLPLSQSSGQTQISLPAQAPDRIATVIAISPSK